jgi:ABC-type polysaccharide/polyol phosphate transport system ATPase subunit
MIFDLDRQMARYVQVLNLSDLPIRLHQIRSISIAGERVYAVTPGAMLIFRFGSCAKDRLLVLEQYICRAEWILGGKYQGDLTSVFACPDRKMVFVASNSQCAIDIFDLDGQFLERRNLWDIAPNHFLFPQGRLHKSYRFGLVNHIFQGPNNEILMTTANINGTKYGSIICFDNGKMVLGDRPFFINGGRVYKDILYILDIDRNRVKTYRWPKAQKKPLSKLVQAFFPQINGRMWKGSIQKSSSMEICDEKLICSVFNGTLKMNGDPPKLVAFDLTDYRQTNTYRIPSFKGLPNPSCLAIKKIPLELEKIIYLPEDQYVQSETYHVSSTMTQHRVNIKVSKHVKAAKKSEIKGSGSIVLKKNKALNRPIERKTMVTLDDVSLCYERSARKFLSVQRNLRVKKKYWALKKITFSITEGETLGIIGRNGSGKSTLSMLCSGVLLPDKGKVTINGKAQMLAIGIGFKVELTGRENIYISGSLMGLSKQEINSKMEDIVSFAELDDYMDEPVRTYSSGMRSRLGFAIATAVKPDILILDEILAVGDKAFKDKAMQRMREMQDMVRSVIIISHNPGQLRKLCTRVLWLEKGQMLMMGDPREVLGAYENFCQNPKKWIAKHANDLNIVENTKAKHA